jgi:pyridoxine kinase
MFAALTVPRLIEAVHASSTPDLDLSKCSSWQSPDSVPAADLPLAKAVQKVLASMQAILGKTAVQCEKEMADWDARAEKEGLGENEEGRKDLEKRRHLALMNASEVKVVRHIDALANPPNFERFRPRAVGEEAGEVPEDVGRREPDQCGCLLCGGGRL